MLETDAPGDVSELRTLVKDDDVDPKTIICVLGKTEGDGCVNTNTTRHACLIASSVIGPLSGDLLAYVSGGAED